MTTPRAVTLRDATRATLRRVRLDDAQGILDLERACVLDGRGVVRVVTDLPPDAEALAKGLRHWTDPERFHDYGCMLVVEPLDPTPDTPSILGVGHLRRFKPAKVHHAAQASLEVHPLAQRLGVGRAIMDALLDWAREVGVNRVQLNVFADNHRAIALYSSLGFSVNGYRRRLIRDPDGAERDDLEMGLLLDEEGTRHKA